MGPERRAGSEPGPNPPRWVVDEMLGRLARYLRFVGHDTLYVKNTSDDEIVRIAQKEHRRLVTRDRHLAARVPGAVLLASPDISEQFQAVVRASPGATFVVTFERCSLCNGRLERTQPDEPGSVAHAGERARWRCPDCGHEYWEGSHTSSIRRRIAAWVPQGVE